MTAVAELTATDFGDPIKDGHSTARAIRKLLLDGGGSLALQINRAHQLKLEFTWCPVPDYLIATNPQHAETGDNFDPNTRISQATEVTGNIDDLLQAVAVIADGRQVTVRQLVKYLCHVDGAVHAGPPTTKDELSPLDSNHSATPPNTRANADLLTAPPGRRREDKMTYQPPGQDDSTWHAFDPDKPPSKGAYRHPEGGWVLPSTDKSGRVYVERDRSTDGVDTMAYAKLRQTLVASPA